MLTYLERLFVLSGVPTLYVARVRLGYLPSAVALAVLGLGLLLTWLLVSRRENLHEAVAGGQLLLFGVTLTALGLSLDGAANFLFLAFLFALVATVLLALFNFRGVGNLSIRELRISRRQAVGYGATIAAVVLAYLVVGLLLPDPPSTGSGTALPLQLSAGHAIFSGSVMS